MDPRIAWHPTELLSNAYSTWTNVWMIAQMNCTNSSTNTNTSASMPSLASSHHHNHHHHHHGHHQHGRPSVNNTNTKNNAKTTDSEGITLNENATEKRSLVSGGSSSTLTDGIHIYHIENLNQFDNDFINSNLNLSVTSQACILLPTKKYNSKLE